MAPGNFSKKYIGDIVIAVDRLNEPNGSTLKSIIDYIRRNLKDDKTQPCVLQQRIKNNLQTAVRMHLLQLINGRYHLVSDISANRTGVRQRGRRPRRKRSRSRSKGRRRRRRRRSRRRQRSRSRSSSGRRSRSPIQNSHPNQQPQQQQQQNDDVEDGNNFDSPCDIENDTIN